LAIDFTLTAQQRDLQLTSRKFAKEVLNEARAAELLATPEQRFLATKPIYEAMVAAGYLRKCIPAPAGGDNAGLIDMAILAEEFYSVNPSVTLTMLGTVLGLLPILLGGTPDQCKRLLGPFLKTSGAPLAGFCSSEPGGSANAASPPPGEGVRTTARREGDNWVINGRKKWVSSATGWNREGANVLCVVCRTDPAAPPDAAISIIAEAARYLSWRACHALDAQSPSAEELAGQAKIFGSAAAVRVITDLMRVVGIDSYDHEAPFARLLQDALALPIFDGGNMGIRRRQLHMMFKRGDYDPLAASGAA
jgi:alkylation response protein AidB-like acyl-CoA dehydrogenase